VLIGASPSSRAANRRLTRLGATTNFPETRH
jgi:hypothetical protein